MSDSGGCKPPRRMQSCPTWPDNPPLGPFSGNSIERVYVALNLFLSLALGDLQGVRRLQVHPKCGRSTEIAGQAKQTRHWSLIRMLCCPFRLPLSASNRFAGGAFRSSSLVAASIIRSFRRATNRHPPVKLPTDLSGQELVKVLLRVGFAINRQKGSHIVFRRGDPCARVVVPDHKRCALELRGRFETKQRSPWSNCRNCAEPRFMSRSHGAG